MYWLDFLALALAAGQLSNTWLFPGGILEGLRETVIAWGTYYEEPPVSDTGDRPSLWDRFKHAVSTLAGCRFCQTHWTPVILLAGLYLPSLFVADPWSMMLRLPIYSLACTRLSLLVHKWLEQEAE